MIFKEVLKFKEFMLEDERFIIVNSLKITDKVIISIDKDRTICKTLKRYTAFSKYI